MIILLLFLLLITPVRLTLLWDHGPRFSLRLWGIPLPLPASVTASGGDLTPPRFMRVTGMLLRTNHARRFLLRHTHLLCLQVMLRIGLADAARTAVLTGVVLHLARLLPAPADIRVQPDFLSSTRLQARCILFFHLGTILITAAMLLAAYCLEAREHPLPHPKEA